MDEPNSPFHHIPVLLTETLHYLAPKPGDIVLDATVGGGGHSEAIAHTLQPGGTLIGIDRDRSAITAAQARLEPLHSHLSIILLHAEFGKLDTVLGSDLRTQDLRFDGALFDLGVSSFQLDAARGFSFRRDEPLDMRMNADAGPTAANLLAELPERALEEILRDYGEERWARRIAAAIVAQRERGEPIAKTGQLAALVERCIPRAAWPKDIHVATRTFQALRIAVNDELGQLQAGLAAVVSRLRPGGRIVAISFHSLEDRIVKRAFAEWAGNTPSSPGSSPAAFLKPEREPILQILTRKPVVPTAEEIARNPRARSAKLRAAERIAP